MFLAVVLVMIAAVSAVAITIWLVLRSTPRRPVEEAAPVGGERAVITLPISSGDRDDAAVRRLVHDAAARAFAGGAGSVEVRRSDGHVIGVVEREQHLRPVADVSALRGGPRRSGRRSTKPVHRQPLTIDDEPFQGSDKLFADRFDLPAEVREALEDPDSPQDVVEAILTAAGTSFRSGNGIVIAADHALLIVGSDGHAITGDELGQAFLRFQESGATRGTALCLGFVNPQELRRREALAPNLGHAGPDGIQRMADAVALGGNPLLFAAPGH